MPQEHPRREVLPRGEGSYAYYVFKQRRKLNPLVIDTDPKRHSGLGVDLVYERLITHPTVL